MIDYLAVAAISEEEAAKMLFGALTGLFKTRTRMDEDHRDIATAHRLLESAAMLRDAHRDRDRSAEGGQTAKQAGPKARARAEGIAQAQSGNHTEREGGR